MKKHLALIFLLVFIQFSYGQNKIAVNYIGNVQVSLDPNYKLLVGIEFNTSADGYISKIRLLNRNNEWGDHLVKIQELSKNQTSVLAGPFNWYFSTQIQGWIEYDFLSPVPVSKDKTYILSITKSTDSRNSGPEFSGSLESNPNSRYSEKQNAENQANNLVYNRIRSDDVIITAFPKLIACIIGQSQTIDYNTQPNTLKELTPPAGGTGNYYYNWQSSLDGINWTSVDDANLVSYSPPPLTADTWYRLIASSGNFGSIASNSILIKVNPKLIPSTIGQNQTICYNSKPAALNQISLPSGGTGVYTYQWQDSRDGNTWTDITGANNGSYSPPVLNINTWYRLNISSNYKVSSNPVLITVLPRLISATIEHDQTICFGTEPVILSQNSPPSGGTGEYNYQWQSSRNNNNWTDINGANSASYSPPALTANTWYRQIVTSGCTLSSNSVLITVLPRLISSTIGHDQTICIGSEMVMLSQISPPSGGTGNYNYQWQISGNNDNWTDINGANSASYSPPDLTTDTWYRQNVTGGCTVSSNSVLIKVLPSLISGTVGYNQTICFDSEPLMLNQISPPSGGTGEYNYQWQSSRNNSNWTDINGLILASYSPPDPDNRYLVQTKCD